MKAIETKQAPQAIGTYSQAVKVGNTVYLSGQIPLDADTMRLIEGSFALQVRQVFLNLSSLAHAAGGDLIDVVKLNIYLTDLSRFDVVNEVMEEFFKKPYPARAAVQVAALPKNAEIEVEGVMNIGA